MDKLKALTAGRLRWIVAGLAALLVIFAFYSLAQWWQARSYKNAVAAISDEM